MTKEPLVIGPERIAMAMRRADLCANEVSEYEVPNDYWTSEAGTPEWLRDDYRYMAGAAMRELALATPANVAPEGPVTPEEGVALVALVKEHIERALTVQHGPLNAIERELYNDSTAGGIIEALREVAYLRARVQAFEAMCVPHEMPPFQGDLREQCERMLARTEQINEITAKSLADANIVLGSGEPKP
jgi:hypothetical protein